MGATQDLLSLDEPFRTNQRLTEDGIGGGMIGAIIHGNPGGGQGFLPTACLGQG